MQCLSNIIMNHLSGTWGIYKTVDDLSYPSFYSNYTVRLLKSAAVAFFIQVLIIGYALHVGQLVLSSCMIVEQLSLIL